MSVLLFNGARLDARGHPRAHLSKGLWVSVVVHATFAGVLTAVVPTRASEKPSRPRSIPVFMLPSTEVVKLRSVTLEAPRLPSLPVPSRPVHEPVIAKVPKPVAVTPIATRPVEPAPAALVPAKAPERPLEARAPERRLETGLFERANGPRTSQAAAAVATGGFGSAPSSPRGTGESSAAVATGGFGSAASTPRGTGQSAAAVATGGFGSGAPSPRGAANGFDNVNVQTAGFDFRASAPAQPPGAAPPKPIDRPVEIVFKPTPEYTDEARSARIEGTVSIELEFTATGDVRVLRVVRGLGHGLDEAAERAALRIRFKPAQSDGRAVDSRATVYITFRLS
jgi:TonB family protein